MKKISVVFLLISVVFLGYSSSVVRADAFETLTGFNVNNTQLIDLDFLTEGNVESVYKFGELIGTTTVYFGFYEIDSYFAQQSDYNYYLVLVMATSTPQKGVTFYGFLDDLYITSYVDSYPEGSNIELEEYSPSSSQILSNEYTTGITFESTTMLYSMQNSFTNSKMNVWNHSDSSIEKYATEWDYTLDYVFCSKTFFREERTEYSGFVVSIPDTEDSWNSKIKVYTRFSFALNDSFFTRVNSSEDYAVSYHNYYYTHNQ